jgi:hypothetical protein
MQLSRRKGLFLHEEANAIPSSVKKPPTGFKSGISNPSQHWNLLRAYGCAQGVFRSGGVIDSIANSGPDLTPLSALRPAGLQTVWTTPEIPVDFGIMVNPRYARERGDPAA